MRNFVILLILLNLAYFVWGAGLFYENLGESGFVKKEAAQNSAETLRLISEVDDLQVRRVGVLQGSLAEAGQLIVDLVDESAELELLCFALGAFESFDDGLSVAGELLELGYAADAKLIEVINGESSFRVHMPPFITFAEAGRKLEELQAKNIDSYVIPSSEGELARGISLGLFGREESALLIQGRLANQGVSSSIVEIFRNIDEVWVEISGFSVPDLEEVEALNIIISETELKLEEKLCETIAPEL